MSKPLVSVIVNVFNGQAYIAECIESILALGDAYPLQIIVVDDASTDGTRSIMHAVSDPRIEYVRLERNVGAAAAINLAFGLVRGEFVARIDYDDRYRSNWLVDSMAALVAWPEAAFVCAPVQMIGPDGALYGVASPRDHGEISGCRDRFRSMLTSHFVTAPTILGRTEHWRRAIPIPVGMNFCDWYMNLTMAETAPVVVIDALTADYRIHPLGMHHTKVADGMGERVTFAVLDRFLDASPRAAELAPFANGIRARHYAEWGDKYFGARMNADALRCYKRALRAAPSMLLRGGRWKRALGLLIGRETYDAVKALRP